MAGISVASKTSSSVTLYVSGLDPNWSNGTRTVYWYLGSAGGAIPTPSACSQAKTAYIDDGVSSGGEVTFTGLSPSTNYGIYCEIYHGSTFLADAQGSVRTDAGSGGGGGGSESNWKLYTESLGIITAEKRVSISLEKYQCNCYSVYFSKSGMATFQSYSTGDEDPRGYLSTSSVFDSSKGEPKSYLASDDDTAYTITKGWDFIISCYVQANTTYYVWVRDTNGKTSCTTKLYITPPQASDNTWVWSDKAYNALVSNGKTRDVPYTEWNAFVEFVSEKTGYSLDDVLSENTGYSLRAALMDASDKKLYADKFNVVRTAIGSINTFQSGTNSIRDHYNETFRWDMQSGEVVKGQYLIDLTNYVNAID